jgi:hypothetical protein
LDKSVTAQSNESPDKILSGQQVIERLFMNAERKASMELGNLERFKKWQETDFFDPARQEWRVALKLFAEKQDLESVLVIRAGVQDTPAYCNFVLTLLRRHERPEEVLKNQAAAIHDAALNGDVEFFEKIGLALQSRRDRKPEDFSLSFNVLRYWFAGLLWLMNAKAGHDALRAYTSRASTKDAYRKACLRLRLNGYKDRMRNPAVLAFNPKRRSYQYAAKWTRME